MSFFFSNSTKSDDPKVNPAGLPKVAAKEAEQAPSKDAKATDGQIVSPPLNVPRHLRMGRPGGKGGRITVRLCGQYAGQGGSSGTQYTAQALSPIGVQDWAGFAALYDLARVKAVTAKMAVTLVGAGNNLEGYWAMAWDPSNPTAYTNPADLLTAERFVGPISYGNYSNSGTSTTVNSPQPVNATGFVGFHKKLPTPKEQIATGNSSGVQVVGGGWIATSATTYIVGYVKALFASAGTGAVISGNLFVWYDVEFRSRT